MKASRALLCPVLVLVCCSLPVSADNLPGDYTPYPAGLHVLGARYTYSFGGDYYAQGNLLDGQMDYQSHDGLVSYSYYGGKSVRWGLIGALPFGKIDVTSKRLGVRSSDTGIADPYVIAAIWPLVRENYHLGVSGWLWIPVGSYEPDRLVNQGLNAWSGKAEVNFTWMPNPKWSLEVTAASRFFADNHDFGPSHVTLERAARNTLEAHLGRYVQRTLLVSLDYFYHWGSETTVNGVARGDEWDDHAVQLSAIWKLGHGRAITGWYRNDFVVRNGVESQTLALRFMQAF
jgi:hypothetical protein